MLGDSSAYSIVSTREQDMWKTVVTFTQGLSYDGINWEEKTMSTVAYNKDKARSISEATGTMAAYLAEKNFNLFETPKKE